MELLFLPFFSESLRLLKQTYFLLEYYIPYLYTGMGASFFASVTDDFGGSDSKVIILVIQMRIQIVGGIPR